MCHLKRVLLVISIWLGVSVQSFSRGFCMSEECRQIASTISGGSTFARDTGICIFSAIHDDQN